MLPKESSPIPQKRDKPRYCHNWHWLIKHPVEFSKNNRTPQPEPLTRPVPRGTRSTLPAVSALSNPRFATEFNKQKPHRHPKNHTTLNRAILKGFPSGRPRRAPEPGPARSPVSLAARQTLLASPSNTKSGSRDGRQAEVLGESLKLNNRNNPSVTPPRNGDPMACGTYG